MEQKNLFRISQSTASAESISSEEAFQTLLFHPLGTFIVHNRKVQPTITLTISTLYHVHFDIKLLQIDVCLKWSSSKSFCNTLYDIQSFTIRHSNSEHNHFNCKPRHPISSVESKCPVIFKSWIDNDLIIPHWQTEPEIEIPKRCKAFLQKLSNFLPIDENLDIVCTRSQKQQSSLFQIEHSTSTYRPHLDSSYMQRHFSKTR